MGKATITASLGAGRYTATLHRDRTRIEARVALLTADNADLQQRITALDSVVAATLAAMNTSQSIYNALSSTLSNPPTEAELSALSAAQLDLIAKQGAYESSYSSQKYLELKKKSQSKTIDKLNSALDSQTKTLWCADYTDDKTGEVGTIEIGRSDSISWVIQPDAYPSAGNATYSGARDGDLQPILGGTPASVFYNYAMLPGVDKWKPKYRVGIITAIAGDTCTVLLDPLSSTHQNLSVNQSTTVDATITYMNCNGVVFEVDDRVIVAFEGMDWAVPKVIGFESSPKPCVSNLNLIYWPVGLEYLNGYKIDTSFNYISNPVLKYPDGVGYVQNRRGQFMDNKYWCCDSYTVYNSSYWRYPLIVYENNIQKFTIADITITPGNYRTGYGVCCASNDRVYVLHYLAEKAFSTDLNIHWISRFGVYSASGTKITESIIHDSLTGVNYSFFNAVASVNGVISVGNDDTTGNPGLLAPTWETAIWDTSGDKLATFNDGLNYLKIGIAASDRHFYSLVMTTGELSVLSPLGAVLTTTMVTYPATPSAPTGCTGSPTIYRHLSADMSSVCVVSTFEYPSTGNKAQMVVDRYMVADDGVVTYHGSSGVHVIDNFFQSATARPDQ